MKSLTVTPFIRDSFENYQKSACGITLDIGRQRINQKELLSLIDFVKEKKMIESFNEMRKGKIVNASEHRSALHTSLRDPSPDAPHAAEVHQTLEAFCKFAEDVRNWKWRSDIGPKCVYNALRPNKPEIKLHFLASADGVIFDRITSVLDPFSTLIVISSKSFKTQETRANTQEILDWLKKAGIPEKDFKHHVVVVSAKPDAVEQFGLPKENFFPIWDWVGGRFSVWGAIGLPVAIALGARTSKPRLSSYCFLPYDERLRVMVDWLQQLEMESLGKSTAADGTPVIGKTSLAVWGGHGNESQHSFYQFLREGTAKNAIDVFWCEKPGHAHKELHRVLMANAKAQTEALVTRDPKSKYFNVVSTVSIEGLTAGR